MSDGVWVGAQHARWGTVVCLTSDDLRVSGVDFGADLAYSVRNMGAANATQPFVTKVYWDGVLMITSEVRPLLCTHSLHSAELGCVCCVLMCW